MSLRTCIEKAGTALAQSDKMLVMELAEGNRRAGMDADTAARAAVDAVLAQVQAELDGLAGGRTEAPAAAAPTPPASDPKVGDMVKLTKPGLNGRVNIAGRVERIMPDGRLEIRTQNDGIMTVAKTELGHKLPAVTPRFKVGDLIVVRNRMSPSAEPITVAIKQVSVLADGIVYGYVDPRFTGEMVENGAAESEVEAAPPGAQATVMKQDGAPNPSAALEVARNAASSDLQIMQNRAAAAGTEKLAAALRGVSVSGGQMDGPDARPPAYIQTLRESFEKLLKRAKANPTDDFTDIRLGNAPSTKVLTPEQAAEARNKRLAAIAQLANIIPPSANEPERAYGGQAPALKLTREQEAAILPIVAEILDSSVMEGHKTFQAAASIALEHIRAMAGDHVADALTIKHLQGAYISMSSRYADGEVDDLATVAQFKSKDQLKETTNAADPNDGVEPDSPDGQPPGVAPPVLDGRDGAGEGNGGTASAPGGRGGRPGGGARLPRTGPAPAGAPSDPGLFEDEPDAPAGDPVDERGPDDGDSGPPAESLTDEGVEEAARRAAADRLTRGKQQREAEGTPVVLGDIDNIRDTLPVLLPEQQDDVLFAEKRFAVEDGYGVLFTNGTGTGKTYTGLGIIKRYAKQGKTNILVVVPGTEIRNAWIRSAPAFNLTATALADTTDAGRGIVVTTYANLRDNVAVARRKWDLVVSDEAHKNGAADDGSITDAADAIRALTLHPDGVEKRTRMLHPALAKQIDELNAKLKEALDIKDRRAIASLTNQMEKPLREFAGYRQEQREIIEAGQGATRPRAVFLSATPFAREKNVTWAQGYLFDWNKGHPLDSKLDPYQAFMVSNFGYRIRYSKLTEPGRGVNRGILQRAFNTRLKREGVLSGRMISSEFDYDRRFVEANSNIGRRIDAGLAWFWDTEVSSLGELPVDPKADYEQAARSAMHAVSNKLRRKFDYLTRLRMLEAVKAEAAIPYIRAHMEAGRKVVVFHDLIKGQRLDPFGITFDAEQHPVEAAILARWQDEFADLVGYNWDGLKSPIEAFQAAFGDKLRLLNGQMGGGKGVQQRSIDDFNNDELGPLVLLTQSAKDEGWSGHDTTGKHPRVLVNLGLPLRPTQAIQQEGRIYRVGQSSNAMFRYFNTRTNWEREAFANQMSRRADAAENLAMGDEARGLLDAYVTSFEETDAWAPGYEGEGTGGKAADRAMAGMLTEFDLAKTHYWAQLKKTSKTKAQEGVDYFATPEPLGLKMMQWLDLRPTESFMEPSAGHGAIARWVPEGVTGLAIEPSPRLAPRLELAFDGKVRQQRFEDLDAVNKADGIGMNPPFNKPGAKGAGLAFEHLAKAYNQHLEIGGRLAALIPEGPAADARLEKFLTGTSERPTRVLGTVQIDRSDTRELRKGDKVFTKLSWARNGILDSKTAEGNYRLKVDGTNGLVIVEPEQIIDVDSRGPMKETVPNSEGAHVVATIRLPADTFARAGTSVRTRIVIIDKLAKDQIGPARVDYDFSQLESVEELFDEIEHLAMPERTKPRPVDVDDDAAPAAAQPEREAKQAKKEAKKSAAEAGEELAQANNLQVIEHLTRKEKLLRGVVLRHITLAQAKAGEGAPAPYSFVKDGGVFISTPSLPAVLERFPLPPVAQEERAVYAVRQPDANYDVDLFGQAVPTPARGASRRRPAPVQHVQPATTLSVRSDLALPGVYRVSSQLVEVGNRTMPVAAVRTWQDAAAALSSLTRYAVEHFDALVVDRNGKPLAVIGSFKGDVASTVAYPATVLTEALRIEGAHAVWAVHNHPSGFEELSDSDYFLSGSMGRAFAPSRIKWMGLAAVGTDGVDVRYMAATERSTSANRDTVRGIVVPSKASMTVPVVERTITRTQPLGVTIDSPQVATNEVARLMAADPRPGLLLVSTQHAVVGWVPVDPADMASLAGTGRYEQLINAASEGNARGVIIANPGGAIPRRTLDNIASALMLSDVRTLDVIDTVAGTSMSEKGLMPSVGLPVLNGIEGPVIAGGVPMRDLQAAVREATLMWDTAPGMPRVSVVASATDLPADIQQMLRDMNALESTRGLMMPDGRVFLIADRINNVAEGQAVLFHEVYGHFGLRAFLGQASYETQMGVLRMANPRLAAEANGWFGLYGQEQINARVKNGMTRADAARAVRALAIEEALADRASANEVPKGWKLLMARLQKALRARGWDGVANMLERMTEAETHALLMSARQVLHGQAPHANTVSAELGGAMDRTGAQSRFDQTQTPAFRRWFGDSKVVDAQGKPLVVYHGTDKDFAAFDITKMGDGAGHTTSFAGFFFSADATVAGDFPAVKWEGWPLKRAALPGQNLMPVYLSISNPLTMTAKEFQQKWVRNKASGLELRAEAIDAGHDGIRITGDPAMAERMGGEEYGADAWVAFRPEQIKSALGNSGAFDPNTADILFSRSGSVAPGQAARLESGYATGNSGAFSSDPSIVLSQARPATAAPTAAPAGLKPSTGPLDVAARLPLGWAGKYTGAAYTGALNLADGAMHRVGGSLWEYVKAGTVDRYGLTAEHIEADNERAIAIKKMLRRSTEIVDKLRVLSPAESRIAYLWMSDKTEDAAAERVLFAQLPEAPRLLLESVKLDIEQLSDEAVELGLLSAEVRDRNRMAYLHRSYKKHLEDETLAEAKRARARSILGNQLKMRGMRQNVTMDRIGTADWWQRKTRGDAHDPSLKGQKFYRLERRSTPDENTPQLFEDENGQRLGQLRELMYWPVGEPIPAMYADWRNDGTWEARFFDKRGQVGMHRDFSLAERTKLGEIQEVKYALAVTLNQMARDVETARYLDWVARNESVLDADQIPDGHEALEGASTNLGRSYLKTEWVQVPTSKVQGTGVPRYGHLAGRWVPGPVWNDIRQIIELGDQGVLSKAWQATLRAWKISKTALSPVTHMNNVMSNFMLADLHDIQARHIYKAAKAWATHKTDPAMKELVGLYYDNGGDSGKFSEGEIREELFGPLLEQLRKEIEADAGGVAANIAAAQVVDLLQHRQFRQAFAAMGDTLAVRTATWVPRKLMKLYGSEDELFRLAAFIKATEDGLNNHDAGKFARESFLNYDIRAPWINAMRRSAWPFFAFTYRAAPMLARIGADKPHKVLKYHMLSAMLTGVSYGMRAGVAYLAFGMVFGDADDEEEKERAFLPDEKAGKVWGFLTPKLWRAPWDDKHDSPVFVDIRRWVPGGDIVDTGQTHSILPIPPALSLGGPLGLVSEFFANKSAFTGKEIVDRKNDDWDEIGKKYGDWLWKGVAPNFPGVPGTYSTEALVKTWKGAVAAGPFGEEKASLTQAVVSAVGVKVGSYPMPTLKFNEERGQQASKAKIMSQLRADIRALERNDPPKTDDERAELKREKDRLAAKAQAKFKRMGDELREKNRKAAGQQ